MEKACDGKIAFRPEKNSVRSPSRKKRLHFARKKTMAKSEAGQRQPKAKSACKAKEPRPKSSAAARHAFGHSRLCSTTGAKPLYPSPAQKSPHTRTGTDFQNCCGPCVWGFPKCVFNQN